jgi:formylglycine-generating enzyme required for sulfatase activity
MKRAGIFGISMLLIGVVSMTPARVQAANMAVLVVGVEPEEASTQFAIGLRADATQAGYTVKTDAAVTAKLDELRTKHANNETVDTTGLMAWGKENNIDFVQLVVEKECDITVGTETRSGREQVIQVVSCGTEKYSGRKYYRTQFVPHEEMPLAEVMEDMVYVTGGTFELVTNYYVRLSNFRIGKHEVTQKLWKDVMGDLPSQIKVLEDKKPIGYINYEHITRFLTQLNAMTGRNYRLPTEAEWEYAARGCNAGICATHTYSGSSTIGDVAWYNSNSSNIQEVGKKLPNGLGLYDMSGNVFERCSDWFAPYNVKNSSATPAVNPTGPTNSTSSRVVRGGSYGDGEGNCRVTQRYDYPPAAQLGNLGFRLVLQ